MHSRVLRRAMLACTLVAGLILSPANAQANQTGVVLRPIRTKLPLVGFNMMLTDHAHRQVFVTGTPTANSSMVVLDYRGNILKEIEGLFGASGMALDRKNHILYVALNTAAAIAAIDTDTLTETNRWLLDTDVQCPESLALIRGYVYFGLSHSCSVGGIGVLDPSSGLVRAFSGGLYPDYYPVLDSSPGARGILIASDRGLSPATLYEYRVRADGEPRFIQSVRSPCDSSNLGDLDIMSNGVDVMTASGSPYHICAFRVDGLTRDGTYPTGPYPNGVEVSPDSLYIAAGINGIYSPDLFVFQVGSTQVLAKYDFAQISPEAPNLFARGEGWGKDPQGRWLLFAVTNNSYEGTAPIFHVLLPSL